MLIISDASMDKDKINVHEVKGLTIPGNNIAKYDEDYVVFIKSHWLMKKVNLLNCSNKII